MYYMNENQIQVELPGGDTIYINNDSKFYEFVKSAITSEEKIRTVRDKIPITDANRQEAITSLNIIQERIMRLIERRARDYRRVSWQTNFLKVVEEGDRDSTFEDFKLADEILNNEINILDEYALDPNPIIILAKVDDIQTVMGNMEEKMDDFEKEFSIEPRRRAKRHAQISEEILGKHQVSKDSFAYVPLSNGIKRDMVMNEALTTARYHLDGYPGATELFVGMQAGVDKSREILKNRYDHYGMYRGTGVTMPDNLRGASGDCFYDRINPLDQKTIDGCGQMIRYSIEGNVPAAQNISNQVNSDMNRIANFETTLVDTSKSTVTGYDGKRHYKPKDKERTARKMLGKINEKAVIIGATVALATSLIINGINLPVTTNSPTAEPEITGNNYGYVDVIEMPEELRNGNPYNITPIYETETHEQAQTVPLEVETPKYAERGLKRLVDKMSDEDIKIFADAMREGNDSIVNFRGAYVIANGRYENDREFLKEAFGEFDSRIDRVKYEGDSHQLAYQMITVMDALIRSEIEEALEEKGMDDVDMKNITSYVTYTSGDKVKAYDYFLGNGNDRIVLTRSDHLKGTLLDQAIRGRYELERATKIVAAFDPNEIMASATRSCYYVLEAYLSGDVDLIKNGDVSDIKREKSKGFREVDGDSLDYGEIGE